MNTITRIVLGLFAALFAAGCATHCAKSDIQLPSRDKFEPLCFPAKSGHCYPVYRTARRGPPVLVLHELNGLSAAPLDFSLELSERRHWTVYAPVLFGEYGDDKAFSAGLALKNNPRWDLKNPNDSGQVLRDVAEMTDWISGLHGGQRVIVMGNCLTGNFPLALLGRRSVKAGTLCQPALPLPGIFESLFDTQPMTMQEAWAIPPRDYDAAVDALRRRDKALLGFHYLHDPIAPFVKFTKLHERLNAAGLGHRFKPVVLRPPLPKQAPPEQQDPEWWQPEPTEVKRGFLKPHNTVTQSGSACDRQAMRQLLYEQMDALRKL